MGFGRPAALWYFSGQTMSEDHPQSPVPRRPDRASTPRSESLPEIGVAVSASSGEGTVRWLWVATAALILLSGLTLYAARSAVGPWLDGWLPDLAPAAPESVPEVVAVEEASEPEVAPPEEPRWTFDEIEQALLPLPEATETLIAEGRDELSQFAGLDSRDETQVLLTRNRWTLWGRIWHNRVTQIRRQMPPLADCEAHTDLEEACRAMAASIVSLDAVPRAETLDQAREHFSEAGRVLDAQYGPPRRDP